MELGQRALGVYTTQAAIEHLMREYDLMNRESGLSPKELYRRANWDYQVSLGSTVEFGREKRKRV